MKKETIVGIVGLALITIFGILICLIKAQEPKSHYDKCHNDKGEVYNIQYCDKYIKKRT